MPRYVRVLETAAGTPRVSDALAQWVDVDDLIEIPEGGASVPDLELATPSTGDGVETEFVFVGVPKLPMDNGVPYSPNAFTVNGTTVTFDTAPEDGHEITALTW